jgi:hypothetical protein
LPDPAERGRVGGSLTLFSLTPALSRWERERRIPPPANRDVMALRVWLKFPLSQRERAGVRENGLERAGRWKATELCPNDPTSRTSHGTVPA